MSDSNPDPEAVVPDELRAAMEDLSPTVLRAVADYATALAEDEIREQADDEVREQAKDEIRGHTGDGAGARNGAGTTGRVDNGPSERASGVSPMENFVGSEDDSVGTADDSVGTAAESGITPASEGGSKATSDDSEEAPEMDDNDRPDGVPGKASITVKKINDNQYYYWQWREGENVKSKYYGPVDSGS